MAWSARTKYDNPLRRSTKAGETTCYQECARLYDTRGHGRDWKRISDSQSLYYDAQDDCYLHQHHRTVTVRIYRDRYMVNTGGWDTPSTWAFVAEFCPISVYKPSSKLIKHDKVVGWAWEYGKGYTKFAPYYDRIEVDGAGVPLHPRPVTFERVNKAAIAAFNANVRKVRDKLRTRMLVGEWDSAPVNYLHTTSAYVKAFETLAAMEWIDHDFVTPLFFRLMAEDPAQPRSCTERFEHAVRYARQSPSLKETYEKECF